MINRALIRIKVVQLLYSYFLVQNNFAVQSSPTAPTKEKRFAYALYLDYLYLMMKIADNIRKSDKTYPLANTRFIQRLSSDNIMKSIRSKYAAGFPLASCVDDISQQISSSAIYKKFLSDPALESSIWPEIFRIFISPNLRLGQMVENYENYSMRGVDRAKEMVAQTFSEFAASQDNIAEGISELKLSLEKARELYFRLLLLPVDLTYMQEVELDERRHRYNRTPDDMNPNPKFIDNELVKLLDASVEIKQYAEDNKIAWTEQNPEILRHLLYKITSSEIYAEYMEDPTADLHGDGELWKKLMRNVILTDDVFLDFLERKSVYWNDDIDIISEFVIKTFRNLETNKENGERKNVEHQNPVFPMFKDAEDAKFGPDLFTAVVKKNKAYRDMIDQALNTQHWEADRLAYMDVVIMETALAEILSFPKIPIQASLNEYIEIAKSYSSSKSGAFINGLLASVITNLKDSGKLLK